MLRSGPDARTTGFVRAGLANRRISTIDLAVDAGVLLERPFGAAGPPVVTAHEIAFEIGARWQPWPSVAVQPLLQRTWNVGGRPGDHATLVGARIE